MGGFDEGRWRFIVETALVGLVAAVLSFLAIWATLTGRIGVEAIVVIIVTMILAIVAIGQAMKYYARSLALHERARESVAKTTRAAAIMMEFLREFTLKNQETISQMAESQKGRVIDELGNLIDALAKAAEDAGMRRELARFQEIMRRKISDIPSGVAFPLPRLEQFDHALLHMEEPERMPTCPACGSTQARARLTAPPNGIRYTCIRCGHEFDIGITVLLEKNT